jgi:hypothetical protein
MSKLTEETKKLALQELDKLHAHNIKSYHELGNSLSSENATEEWVIGFIDELKNQIFDSEEKITEELKQELLSLSKDFMQDFEKLLSSGKLTTFQGKSLLTLFKSVKYWF